MSAGKPLGSRAVLLLDLDFSFFRREKQAEVRGAPGGKRKQMCPTRSPQPGGMCWGSPFPSGHSPNPP